MVERNNSQRVKEGLGSAMQQALKRAQLEAHRIGDYFEDRGFFKTPEDRERYENKIVPSLAMMLFGAISRTTRVEKQEIGQPQNPQM